MKKTVNAVVATLLFVSLLSSCSKEKIWGEGPIVTETRAVINFRGVSTSVPGTVYFKIDPVYKVEIQAQRNILDVMRTEVVNGVLQVSFRNNVRVKGHEDVVINISAPTADFFSVSGVGDISTTGDMVIGNMDLSISGSGNIWVEKAIVAGKIDASISGSGSINVGAGSAKTEELRISGSGNMDLSNVPAETAETHISGSGDMKVNLSQSLYADISGSGSVYYKGHPSVSMHVSGSGTVRPL